MVLFIIIINNNINTNIIYNFIDSSLKIVKRGLKFFFFKSEENPRVRAHF